jgi:glycosyltransferase involved in cell wall biosynthesis
MRQIFWHDMPYMRDAHYLNSNDRFQYTPTLTCVMPAYNEGKTLGSLVPQVLQALQALSSQVEIVLINDGSRDDTLQVIEALCQAHLEVVGINLSRNFGKEAALTAGIDAARGEVVVLMDSDGQHPVSLVAEMMRRWREGSDVVYAIRRTRDDQSALHAGLTGMFYKFINAGNRVKIPAHAGDFRLMDCRVVEALKQLPERNRFMKGLYAWVGFASTAIDYEPLPRAAGESSFGLRGSFALALTGVLAFSIGPLRVLTITGLMLATLALGYGAWVIGMYLMWGVDVPGYATLVVGMMFFSGIQLLSIGVLAEYVGRIYEEVKQRPMYLISHRWGAGLSVTSAKTALPEAIDNDALTPI